MMCLNSEDNRLNYFFIRKIMCTVSCDESGNLYAQGSNEDKYVILDAQVTPYRINSNLEFIVLDKDLAFTNSEMIPEAFNALTPLSRISFSIRAARACIKAGGSEKVRESFGRFVFGLCVTLVALFWGLLRCLGFNTLAQTNLELGLYTILYAVLFTSFMITVILRRDYQEFLEALADELTSLERSL